LQGSAYRSIRASWPKPKIQAPLKGQLNGIEILTSISEVSFEEAFDSSIQRSEHGRAIPVLAKDLLIRSKLARGDEQDLKDVMALCGATAQYLGSR
jgi:hypothetical protein